MLFISRLPLNGQAQIVVSTLAEHGANLDVAAAEAICLQLAGREEKEAAKWLRGELAKRHIAVKHVHALRLIGKLAGREGWHGAPLPGSAYRLMLAGLETPQGWEVASADPRELLELLCTALIDWSERVATPRVVTLRRGPRELLFTQNVLKDEQGFSVLLKAEAATDWDAWYTFQNYSVKRLRRLLEEGDAPVFLDGAVLGMISSAKAEGVRELTVLDRGIELGRGSELHVLELMEAEAGDELMTAEVNLNSIKTERHLFHLMESYRKLEPLLETSERTLLHPETEHLLRQYQLFRRKVGSLSKLKMSGTYSAPDGIPSHVPADWNAIGARMSELGVTPASLFDATGSTELADALAAKPMTLSLAAFVNLARVLAVKDFNMLVRAARWSDASKADADELRSVLYAVDELRFVVGRDFPHDEEAQLREACEELNASRRVRQMQQAGAFNQPMDELVFAADGDEFLGMAEECGAEVRMQVTTTFMSTEGLDVPIKLELPAVGRRLTLLMRPQVVSEQSAS